MKHKFAFLFAYMWVLLLGVLGVGLLCFAPKEARASEYENRMLAAMPAFSSAAAADGSYMTDMETFLADAIFGRSSLIAASNRIRDSISVLEEDPNKEEKMVEAFLNESTEPLPEAGDTPQQAVVQEAPQQTDEQDDEPQQAEAEPTAATESEDEDEAADPGVSRMYMINLDGSETRVYTYSKKKIQNTANVLNAYRGVLPEDGNVFFYQVPFASTARGWWKNRKYTGWCSTVEEAIAQYTDDGVYVLNAPQILSPYMEEEQLYFLTDHHWTARGAYRAVNAAQEIRGVPTVAYDDYTYQSRMMTVNPQLKDSKERDKLEVPDLIEPAESYIITKLTEQSRKKFVMFGLDSGYLAFLTGTRGPWRRLVTGYQTGRKALVVCDSFGNAFTSYLFPYYDEIHMVDFRPGYYDMSSAGAGTSTYIQQYGVDDIYFVLSTSSGINSTYMTQYAMQYFKY